MRPQGYVERFGVDALRYFVMREMVLGQDANFTDDVFLTRYNADLANDLGNVVSRVTTMIQRYCDGRIPDRPRDPFEGPTRNSMRRYPEPSTGPSMRRRGSTSASRCGKRGS